MQTLGTDAEPLVGGVDIWCPKTGAVFDRFFQERLRAGEGLWTYVCCSPVYPYANMFIDRSAVEPRVLFWLMSKANATGFLYWATDWYAGIAGPGSGAEHCFPEDTVWKIESLKSYRDAWVHVNGDGLLLYPGKRCEPLPSIRLFVVRDGIEDYEVHLITEKAHCPGGSRPGFPDSYLAEGNCGGQDSWRDSR